MFCIEGPNSQDANIPAPNAHIRTGLHSEGGFNRIKADRQKLQETFIAWYSIKVLLWLDRFVNQLLVLIMILNRLLKPYLVTSSSYIMFLHWCVVYIITMEDIISGVYT